MKHFTYATSGTCSKQIDFDIDEKGCLHNVVFIGGCNGNLQGIGQLVEGEDAARISGRLCGLRCGYKARPEERAPARADGVPMMKPQSAYGRVTQLFPKGKEACVEGNAPPAWCYGHYLST